MIKVPGLKEKRKILLTWTSNPCLDETMTEGKEVSSTAPSPSDRNSEAINDYDSEQEVVQVPLNSEASVLNSCKSSEAALPLYNELDKEIPAEGDQSHDSAFESCVGIPEEVNSTPTPLDISGRCEMRKKLSFSLKKKPTLSRAIFEEEIDCTINSRFRETTTTIEEEEVLANAASCSDSNSNSVKERDFDHTPPKVAKLTYAAWKAKREELKLEQKNARAIVVKGGNNVVNPNPVENNNSWSAQPKCKTKIDLKEMCPRCFKRFKTKESLFFHFNATHGRTEKPFECYECPHTFRLGFVKTELYTHLLRRHQLRIKRGCYIIDSEKATFEYETEPCPG